MKNAILLTTAFTLVSTAVFSSEGSQIPNLDVQPSIVPAEISTANVSASNVTAADVSGSNVAVEQPNVSEVSAISTQPTLAVQAQVEATPVSDDAKPEVIKTEVADNVSGSDVSGSTASVSDAPDLNVSAADVTRVQALVSEDSVNPAASTSAEQAPAVNVSAVSMPVSDATKSIEVDAIKKKIEDTYLAAFDEMFVTTKDFEELKRLIKDRASLVTNSIWQYFESLRNGIISKNQETDLKQSLPSGTTELQKEELAKNTAALQKISLEKDELHRKLEKAESSIQKYQIAMVAGIIAFLGYEAYKYYKKPQEQK